MIEDEEGERLSRNTAVMAAGTVVSRLTGFGRVLALGYAIGASRLTDSYNAANTAPNIVYELVLGGVLSATLIPVLVDQKDDEGERNVSALVTAAMAALLALVAIVVLAAPLIVHLLTANNDSASAADQRHVATVLLRLFAPQVLLLGAITFATAILNVRRRFAAPTWSPILLNLWTIAVLVAYPHVARGLTLAEARHDTRGLVFLGLGTTLGYAAQFLGMVPSLRRAGAGVGTRLRPTWDPRNPAVRLTLKLAGWTVGVVVANLGAYVLIVALASGRAADYTVYTWAFAFFQLPHAIVAVSIMSALMPGLAERWSAGDRAGFDQRLTLGIRSTAAVLVPAAVGYALLAHPFIRLVLEHGRVAAASAHTTADTLALFALGLPGFSLYLLLMRAYQARKDTRTMFFLYLGENALTVALALALYPSLHVRGLAVAFVAPYTVFTVVALARLGVARPVTPSLVRIAVATAVMAAAVAACLALFDSTILEAGSAVALGGTVYVLLAMALGVDELVSLLRIRRRPA